MGIDLDPESHRRWVSWHWERVDRDGDGKLTKAEIDSGVFRKALKEAIGGSDSSGANYTRSMMRCDRATDFISRKADNNGDGMLNFAEFEKFTYLLRTRGGDPSEPSNMNGAALWAEVLFAMFDLDGDEFLQRNEFVELHRYFHGLNVAESIKEQEWASLDIEGEGRVDKRRFIKWMTRGERLRVLSEPPVNDPGMSNSSSAPALGLACQRSPSRQGSSPKPPWNRRHHVVSKNDCKPRQDRRYFSRPQSEEELFRFYRTHPNFASQLSQSEMPPPRKPRMILSYETAPPIIPSRYVVSGLESSCEKKIPPWTDLWQPSLAQQRARTAYDRPGTLSLRFGKKLPQPRFDPDWD